MMTREDGDVTLRGELLVTLRHALRQSSRLAEQLGDDDLVGNEARGLLCRLTAIRSELDAIATTSPGLRRADNDPLWMLKGRRPIVIVAKP